MKLESALQLIIFLILVVSFVGMFGDKIADPTCSYMGRFVAVLLFLGTVVYLVVSTVRLARKGERALIFDVVNHVILDPKTKEVMFDIDSAGIVRDHETGDILCSFDWEKKKYFDPDGNATDFHELDKSWLKRKREGS